MRIDSASNCGAHCGEIDTGNVAPLLHEVRHALQELLDEGAETVIDLRALPLAPGEEEQLCELLGRGEVRIEIDALGPSEIVETGFPGVWLSTHHNNEGAVVGRYIEVCLVPRLAAAQQADMQAGLQALCARLGG
jgi:hydrogenase-1 operon protein HyaF